MDPINQQPNTSKPSWFLTRKLLWSILIVIFVVMVGCVVLYKNGIIEIRCFDCHNGWIENNGAGAISTWKTYTNEQYGFEFKYPPNFKITNEDNRYFHVQNNKPSEFELTFSSLWKRDSLTLSEFVHNDTDYENNMKANIFYNPKTETKTTINEITVYRFVKVLGASNEYHFFFLKDDNTGVDVMYLVDNFVDTGSWQDAHPEGATEDPFIDIFNQILSTFKFIK